MDKKPCEVVTLYDSNYRDVVATLRKVADQIEAGEYGEVSQYVLVVDNGLSEIFCGGEANSAESVFLMQRAITRLCNAHDRD